MLFEKTGMAILSPITPQFLPHGQLLQDTQIEQGHINRTYMTVVREGGETLRYIHQHINTTVFPNAPEMMKNIRRVINHLAEKRPNYSGNLHLIPSQDGLDYYLDDDGHYWRCYKYVEGSTSFDIVPNPDIAYQAALTFGTFLNDLSDLSPSEFHITIPDFHNTLFRLSQFDRALANPVDRRVELAQEEIEFIQSHRELAGKLMAVIQEYPEAIRVTHNDTKVNNVLFSEETLTGLTVIDLDTVMPGTALFDIGDLIRTACNTAAEDERDLSKVVFDESKFAAIIRGFAETTGKSLHPAEWDAMPYCGAVITLTIGIRFLTDFLNGDTYFRTHRPNQNLDRARTQIHLVKQMLQQIDALTQIVETQRAIHA